MRLLGTFFTTMIDSKFHWRIMACINNYANNTEFSEMCSLDIYILFWTLKSIWK